MRDGAPLPGLTPAQLVSQLAHRVFGPLQPVRTRIVLDYHGLLEHPAGELIDISRRHRVTTRTISNNVVAVRVVGARLPLTPALITAATRPSIPGDDHLGRVRIATTLGLTPPAANVPAAADPVPPDHLAAARAAARVLTATGPLEQSTLAAAVTRSRRFRTRNQLSDNDFAAALTAIGSTQHPDGRWHPPAGVVPSERYRLIITLAAGRELTRQQMIDILRAAGYSSSSASGRMSSSHPLFRRTGPVRYRLITDTEPGPGSVTDPTGTPVECQATPTC